MKKFLLLAALFFSLCFTAPAAAAEPVVKLTEPAPVFKEAKKIAVFSKDTVHTVTREDERFYYTKIGSLHVKFSKQKAKMMKTDADLLKSANPVKLSTKKHTNVYSSRNPKSKALGHIQPNESIYTQRLKGDYYPVVFGGKTGYIYRKDVEVDKGIPVIMYHDLVQVKEGDNSSVLELEKFQEQMGYLKKNGWQTIDTEQLMLWLQNKIALPEKSVVITFDDGYASAADLAYPVLKAHQFKAVSFLIAGRIGRHGYLTPGQIQTVSDVFSFQNHTFDMHSFNSMNGMAMLEYVPRIKITEDLLRANETISVLLPEQPPAAALAYPYGLRNAETLRAAKAAGMKIAFTITEGNVFQGDSVYQLNRQRIHSGMSLADFEKKLLGR